MTASGAHVIQQQCLAGRARQLTRRITKVYDDALRPLELRVTQLGILVAISEATSVRPAQLARELQLEQSTLSRNLALMKRQGWIRQAACDDGRCQTLKLTRKGEALLKRALPSWRTAQRQTRREIGPELHNALMNWRQAPGGEGASPDQR